MPLINLRGGCSWKDYDSCQPKVACTVQTISPPLKELEETYIRRHIYIPVLIYIFLQSWYLYSPFVALFLLGERGLDPDDVNDTILPLESYASGLVIIPVALLTDRLGYRLMIIPQFLLSLTSRFLFAYSESLWMYRISIMLMGASWTVADQVYSDISNLLPLDSEYRSTISTMAKLVNYLTSAVAAALGQVLYTYGLTVNQLIVYSCIPLALSLVLYFFYPDRLDWEELRARCKEINTMEGMVNKVTELRAQQPSSWCVINYENLLCGFFERARKEIPAKFKELKDICSEPDIFYWSTLNISMSIAIFCVGSYVQSLWYQVDPQIVQNGTVECIAVILQTLGGPVYFVASLKAVSTMSQRWVDLVCWMCRWRPTSCGM
jgi:hypothetical protein